MLLLRPSYSASAVLLLSLLVVPATDAAPSLTEIPKALLTQTRRLLNFGSILGSPQSCSETPYDRILGHPVFQVTTAWGSAYMNMEKLTDLDESAGGVDSNVLQNKNPNSLKSISEEQNEYRTVSLYFMDPDDALAVHSELKQLEQMTEADIRITSVSLGKALRQSANLGNGLVTGLPIDTLSGNLKPVEEGGSLRHKIVPPKRQLFYAARCFGKERVGLLGDNPMEEALTAVLGNSALEGMNLMRRREKRERKGAPKARTLLEAQNAHMEGYVGIPVFFAQGMARQPPKLKQLLSGNRQETPLFFSYEDLQDAWKKMKKGNAKLPEEPTVEVFNLFDVLTSMEKDAWKLKKKQTFNVVAPLQKRFGKIDPAASLDSITFVPSSRAIDYKERISAQGNGKARLRPMR
jgi:hypothetical protein